MDRRTVMRLLDKIAKSADRPRELDEDDFRFYGDCLEEFGWDRVYEALHRLRQSVTRLPTVAEIKSAMGIAAPVSAETAIDLQAKLLVATIESCFGAFGYTNPAGARERIGEVGWAALGGTRGWIELCLLPSYDELPIRLAQIREAARALMLLPPEKRQGQFAPPESSAIDHVAARREKLEAELSQARAMLKAIEDGETIRKQQN